MTFGQVWELYDCDFSDPNTTQNCLRLDFVAVDEQMIEDCIFTTYQHWLYNLDKKSIWGTPPSSAKKPYLLTFRYCRLPNYDAIQKERKRRINEVKQMYEDNQDMQKDLDAFCEENQIASENRETLIEVMALSFNKDNPLPKCTTDTRLVKIALDNATVRHRQNIKATSNLEDEMSQINTYIRYGY
jgi:hypothetical protein